MEFSQNCHVCICLFAGQHFLVRIDNLRVSAVTFLCFCLLLGGLYIFALKFPLRTKLRVIGVLKSKCRNTLLFFFCIKVNILNIAGIAAIFQVKESYSFFMSLCLLDKMGFVLQLCPYYLCLLFVFSHL